MPGWGRMSGRVDEWTNGRAGTPPSNPSPTGRGEPRARRTGLGSVDPGLEAAGGRVGSRQSAVGSRQSAVFEFDDEHEGEGEGELRAGRGKPTLTDIRPSFSSVNRRSAASSRGSPTSRWPGGIRMSGCFSVLRPDLLSLMVSSSGDPECSPLRTLRALRERGARDRKGRPDAAQREKPISVHVCPPSPAPHRG